MIINFFGREIYIRKEIVAAVISIGVVALGWIGFIIGKDQDAVIIPVTAAATPKPEMPGDVKEKHPPAPVGSGSEEGEIKVYVIGCVNTPGIVTLKKGQILDEAIKLAGGATENADLKSVNLVYRLKENVMIYVKSKEETMKTAAASVSQQWNSAGEAGPGVEIVTDSAGAVLNAAQGGSAPKKININTAMENELETLPGVGKETAKDIIAYREKTGGFKTINDIMKVSGIKESRFSKIKDFITTD